MLSSIAHETAKQLERVGLTAEKTKEIVLLVLDGDVRMLFDEVGNLVPIHH